MSVSSYPAKNGFKRTKIEHTVLDFRPGTFHCKLTTEIDHQSFLFRNAQFPLLAPGVQSFIRGILSSMGQYGPPIYLYQLFYDIFRL